MSLLREEFRVADTDRNILLAWTLEEAEGLYETLHTIGRQYHHLRPVQCALLDQMVTILQKHPDSTVIDPRDLAWLQALPVYGEGETP